MLSRTPEIHVCDTKICRRACIKDDWAKHDEHENIEKKVDIFHNLNGILAKTRNLIFYEINNLVFLSLNQMPRNASPARQLNLGEFNFLKCTTLLIPVPIWVRFMAIKMQKVALLEVFHHNLLTWLTDLQSYNYSLNTDTATRPDFTKIVPTISFQSVLNLSASVDDPFSQGKPTSAWCRRSMHRKSNDRANTRKHSTPPITPSPGCTET